MSDVLNTDNAEKLLDVSATTVTGATYSLAPKTRVIRMGDLEQQMQLVLTDRSTLTNGKAFGV